jgi:hypothetical protein
MDRGFAEGNTMTHTSVRCATTVAVIIAAPVLIRRVSVDVALRTVKGLSSQTFNVARLLLALAIYNSRHAIDPVASRFGRTGSRSERDMLASWRVDMRSTRVDVR